MNIYLKIIFLLVFVTLISCSKKKIPVKDSLLGLEYYPQTKGKFVVYDVDSTVYTDIPKDTIYYKYRIKEKIADSFLDNEGQVAIRLERYIKKYNPLKPYDSIAYTIKEVWLVNATSKSVQIVEGNVRYTKLIFPIQESASWNGNAKNTIGEWQYTYDYIDKAETINGNALNNVLLVKQFFLPTAISYKNYNEKYAKGVGLVYRQIIDVTSATVTSANILDRIDVGIIYTQKIVNYGYE